jgi:hypothetical protein
MLKTSLSAQLSVKRDLYDENTAFLHTFLDILIFDGTLMRRGTPVENH